MPWLVGTSGWQYRDWRGVLYPAGVPQRLWLETYAEQFATVENNNSFYRLPTREMFAAWAGRTPDGFVMAVKASRYLTHIRRLKDPAEPVQRLLDAATGLGDRLGPILLQLPPTWKGDPGLLDDCLAEFGRRGPRGLRVAVEMRHESCWTDEIRAGADQPGGGAGVDGPARVPAGAAVADRGLGLPAAARGRGPAVAALPAGRAAGLGQAAGGRLARRASSTEPTCTCTSTTTRVGRRSTTRWGSRPRPGRRGTR